MTLYKMPKKPIDDTLSTRWGLAALKSVGIGLYKIFGANARIFDLKNMETYRAQRMAITDLSASFGLTSFGFTVEQRLYLFYDETSRELQRLRREAGRGRNDGSCRLLMV